MLRLNQLMQRLPAPIDCGIILSPINRRYFTDFSSSAGIMVITKGKAYLIVDFRYYERAARHLNGCEVVLMKEAYQQISEILIHNNCKTIAVENYSITLNEYKELQNHLKNYEFDDSTEFNDLINKLRMIKTPDEIHKILAAQEITEYAFEHILKYIKTGLTERQIANEIDRFMRELGADDIAFDTIAVSGENSASPHGIPTDKPLRNGEFLTMDFGAKLDGYHSDMTRTVVIGKPDAEMERLYNTVAAGQLLGLECICEGKTGKEIDDQVRSYFDAQGYEGAFGHSLGHGVGLEIHELPNLSPKCEIVLEKGMVVTVEPGLYLPEKFGTRIEDMVLVRQNGHKNLTKCQKEMICL